MTDIEGRAYELGARVGKAVKQHDRGRASHFQRIYHQWLKTLTVQAEVTAAITAYGFGYQSESFDSTQYHARSL
jgi:hypothetical protein